MRDTFPDSPGPFHHDGCLGCGSANPNELGVRLRAEGGRLRGRVRFGELLSGAPGYVHGGAVATVLDDALGTIPMVMGTPAVTANLNVDFRAPIRLGTTVDITAWLVQREGRKIFAAGELRAGDTLVAEATGLFVEAPAGRFDHEGPAVGRW